MEQLEFFPSPAPFRSLLSILRLPSHHFCFPGYMQTIQHNPRPDKKIQHKIAQDNTRQHNTTNKGECLTLPLSSFQQQKNLYQGQNKSQPTKQRKTRRQDNRQDNGQDIISIKKGAGGGCRVFHRNIITRQHKTTRDWVVKTQQD
jgi:hypothetical protein